MNVAARDDLAAAGRDLHRMLPGPAGVLQKTYPNGAHPHDARFCLDKREVGGPIAAALAGESVPSR